MLDFLSSTTENSPKVFGFVHFLVLGIFIALIIAICVFLRKTSDKQNKIILLFFGFWLLLFEILKQIVLIYDSGNYEYDWQHLPLQPCSALMYTIILAGFLSTNKKFEKFNQYLYCFLAVYGFFSGASALVMPSSIFNTHYILILYQTVQHHMVLALLAIYLFVSKRVKFEKGEIITFLKGSAVFLFWCAIGLILNLILYAITKNPEINLMYMGPYTIWAIPLISDFIKITNPWLHIPFYIIVYAVACLISMYIYYGIEKLVKLIANKVSKSKYDADFEKIMTIFENDI